MPTLDRFARFKRRVGQWFSALAMMAAVSGCSTFNLQGTQATHPSLANASLAPLVPVRRFVADLDTTGGHQISPDGKRLVWSGVSGLSQALFVKELATGETRQWAIAARFFTWAQDSRTLVITTDQGGDENTHVRVLDSTDPLDKGRDITPFTNTRSQLFGTLAHSGDLLITSNQRDKKVFDLYRYVAATQTLQLLAQNPGDVGRWLVDEQGQLRARARIIEGRYLLELPVPNVKETWQTRFETDAFDTVMPVSKFLTANEVWAVSNRGRDKLALVKLQLETGNEQVVYEHPNVDVSRAVISDITHQPLMVSVDPDYQELIFFNDVHRRLHALLANSLQGKKFRFSPTSISRDELWLTGIFQSEEGAQTILIDVAGHRFEVLGDMNSRRIHAISPLPKSRPFAFTAKDGLALNGYLTLPQGVDARHLPTVLLVHGGPWARDFWGNDSQTQFLANRGYAVLQVNYRGSSGYGKAFQEKAIGEFAGKMHSDLIDGVDTMIAQGIADPKRIAIAGTSYGGYAALVGMTFTPEKFTCGIDFVGMSDLQSLLRDFPSYWALGKPWWTRYVGDPDRAQDLAKLQAKSPLYKAHDVKGPLLIMHGENDPRVKLDQSIRMVKALENAEKTVQYVQFSGDGHGNQKWSNKLKQYRHTEEFLAQCLGGRSNGTDLFEWGSWAF
jgi:dipeptidyl aminopeptidase/acylaminoacyl peptidase